MRGPEVAVLAATVVCFAACNALFGVDDLEVDGTGVTSSTSTIGGSEGGAGGEGGATTISVAAGGSGGTVWVGGGGAGGDACGMEALGGGEVECPMACASCSNGTCVIECVGENACFNIDKFCPLGWACQLHCSGRSACERAKLHCVEGLSCSVDCDGTGNRVCQQFSLTCPADAPCDIHCGGAQDSCRNAMLQCGADACRATCDTAQRAKNGPSLECNDACLCEPC